MTSRDDDAFMRALLDAGRAEVPPPDAAVRELARLRLAVPLAVAAVTRAAADATIGATKVSGAGEVGAGLGKGAAAAGTSFATMTGKLAIGVIGAASIAMVGLASMGGSAPDVLPAVEAASASLDDGKTDSASGRVIGDADGGMPRSDEPSGDARNRDHAGRTDRTELAAPEKTAGRRAIAIPPTPQVATRPARIGPASPLEEEVALLDRARAIATFRPREALALLDLHAVRFPGGALRVDAAILRVEILVESGDLPAAERFARPWLDDRNLVQVASRMRAILDVKKMKKP